MRSSRPSFEVELFQEREWESPGQSAWRKKKLRLLERLPMAIFPTRHGKKNPKFHRSFRIRNSAYPNRFTSKNRIIHLNPVMSSRFFRASSRESQILKSILALAPIPRERSRRSLLREGKRSITPFVKDCQRLVVHRDTSGMQGRINTTEERGWGYSRVLFVGEGEEGWD